LSARRRKEQELFMASRSQTTFKKRQKELARLEKRQEKAAKRLQSKVVKPLAEATAEAEAEAIANAEAESTMGLDSTEEEEAVIQP
jgi:L-aminopeptidase/D-esterase-like protein